MEKERREGNDVPSRQEIYIYMCGQFWSKVEKVHSSLLLTTTIYTTPYTIVAYLSQL